MVWTTAPKKIAIHSTEDARTVSDDIESRLDETLEDLQAENRIRYSGRHGGYTIVGDDGE